ncbi:MAG TPA: PAS domain S-box protein [Pyrinomonadaceae bacterium]|nr:PAS domain S-box protein [Pyrinomonadaceae bacterium]
MPSVRHEEIKKRNSPNARRIANGCAALVIAGGVSSAAGWLLNAPRLTDWDGHGISIKFNAAVAITSAGIGLLVYLAAPNAKSVVRFFAGATVMIAGLTLVQHVIGIDLGIDNLIVAETHGALATAAPGRMGIPASSSLTLIGSALICATFPLRRRWATALATATFLITGLSLTGYLFGADQLYSIPKYTGIALQTASMIALLGVGVIAAIPDHGLGAALQRDDSGGAMFRRLLVPMIVLAMVLGWVRVWGQEAGYYDTAFGTASRTLAEVVLLIALLWWAAARAGQAEREIRLISRMPEENPYPVMRLTPDGGVLYGNPASAPLCEYLESEPNSPVALELRRVIAESFEDGPRETEIGFEGRTFSVVVAPVAEEGHVNFYGSDITERKEGEIASARLAAIVQSSFDAVIAKDLNGIISSWNTGAERLFGYTADEIIGRPVTTLMPPDRVAEEVDILAKIRRGEVVEHYETVRVRKDGEPREISLTISPVRDGTGKIVGASKIARDVTDRKRVEAAIRDREILQRIVEAQEAERNRIARDLHDHLGQQLTGLRLKLESLRGLVSDNSEAVEQIGQLAKHAERIDSDMSLLAWELRPVSLDSHGLAEALASFVREWSQSHGLRAEFHAVTKDRMPADVETNIYRIAQEALNNILKHADAKEVSVTLNQTSTETVLVIEDDGRGFGVESADIHTTATGGLGLVGMRERAALLGGRFEIESSPGEGTTIFVRIPVKVERQRSILKAVK